MKSKQDKLDTKGQRLNYVRTQNGKTFNDLAMLIGGVKGSTVGVAFRRDTVREVYINVLCEKMAINKEWVLTGEGEIYTTAAAAAAAEVKKVDELKQVPFEEFMEAKYLPINAQAGYVSSLEGSMRIELQSILVPKEFEKGNYIVVEITGQSMYDGTTRAICDGDKLLIKEWDRSYNEVIPFLQHLFVIIGKHGLACKQIIGHDLESGFITCHSYNHNYKDYEVSLSDVYRIFVVKKIVERRIRL